MGWRGIAFGGLVGGFSGGTLGAVFGAILGHRIEEIIRKRLVYVRFKRGTFNPPRYEPLADAYAQLGVRPDASDEEIRRAYRNLAKKYHPDAIRAQGLGEEALAKADERMKSINSAWNALKTARGL
jgi:DnaJ-domain-containing protein 1